MILDATSALVLLSPTAYAAGPEAGHVHMLVLDAEQQPVVGARLRGACRSDDGASRRQKLETPWTCTTDAQGLCSAELRLLPKPGSDRANACKALAPTEITEAGAAPAKSSYFTFFADGQAQSYNLLQKGASWKHGDYFSTGAGKQGSL